jgi:hypothetical protein
VKKTIIEKDCRQDCHPDYHYDGCCHPEPKYEVKKIIKEEVCHQDCHDDYKYNGCCKPDYEIKAIKKTIIEEEKCPQQCHDSYKIDGCCQIHVVQEPKIEVKKTIKAVCHQDCHPDYHYDGCCHDEPKVEIKKTIIEESCHQDCHSDYHYDGCCHEEPKIEIKKTIIETSCRQDCNDDYKIDGCCRHEYFEEDFCHQDCHPDYIVDGCCRENIEFDSYDYDYEKEDSKDKEKLKEKIKSNDNTGKNIKYKVKEKFKQVKHNGDCEEKTKYKIKEKFKQKEHDDQREKQKIKYKSKEKDHDKEEHEEEVEYDRCEDCCERGDCHESCGFSCCDGHRCDDDDDEEKIKIKIKIKEHDHDDCDDCPDDHCRDRCRHHHYKRSIPSWEANGVYNYIENNFSEHETNEIAARSRKSTPSPVVEHRVAGDGNASRIEQHAWVWNASAPVDQSVDHYSKIELHHVEVVNGTANVGEPPSSLEEVAGAGASDDTSAASGSSSSTTSSTSALSTTSSVTPSSISNSESTIDVANPIPSVAQNAWKQKAKPKSFNKAGFFKRSLTNGPSSPVTGPIDSKHILEGMEELLGEVSATSKKAVAQLKEKAHNAHQNVMVKQEEEIVKSGGVVSLEEKLDAVKGIENLAADLESEREAIQQDSHAAANEAVEQAMRAPGAMAEHADYDPAAAHVAEELSLDGAVAGWLPTPSSLGRSTAAAESRFGNVFSSTQITYALPPDTREYLKLHTPSGDPSDLGVMLSVGAWIMLLVLILRWSRKAGDASRSYMPRFLQGSDARERNRKRRDSDEGEEKGEMV